MVPRKNGDLGVELLTVVLDLAFGLEQRPGCKFHEVPSHQLSIVEFFCAKRLRGLWSRY